MFNKKELNLSEIEKQQGIYICTKCGSNLFAANKKFNAGCGFPSFWEHLGEQVKLCPLDTYGRHRIQLLCNNCNQHLGHLFPNISTPTKVRYCINEKAIKLHKE